MAHSSAPWRATRLHWAHLLRFACAVSAGLAAGCSSPLTEYQCSGATDCLTETGLGVCQQDTGFCSFVDTGCESGFRYGEASGALSRECVAEDGASNLDAGPRAGEKPIAFIAPLALPCGETTLTVDGRGSRAADDGALERFEWSLVGPGDADLGTLAGSPNDAVPGSALLLGGEHAAPLLNLTPYMDEKALKVESNGFVARVFQTGARLVPGEYVFFGAVGSDEARGSNGDQEVFVEIRDEAANGVDDILLQATVAIDSDMGGFGLEFDVPELSFDVAVTFEFPNGGRYWLDNLGIERRGVESSVASDPILANRSFEDTVEPWSVVQGSEVSISANTLPLQFARYGEYRIELVVVDGDGIRSEPVSETVLHEGCGVATPPGGN